jgi:RNA polymerase sigma-70 factor (ECF subfamily)
MERMVLSSEHDKALAVKALTWLLDARQTPDPRQRVEVFEAWYEIGEHDVLIYVASLVETAVEDPLVEDITQEAIILAFQAVLRRKFEYKNALFTTYVKRIAYNQLKSYYRRQRPSLSVEELAQTGRGLAWLPTESVEEALDDEAQMLSGLVETLSARRRRVFELYYFEGRDYREIAEILGMSVASVRQEIHRGLKQLRSIATL